jgi:hypothetical protein
MALSIAQRPSVRTGIASSTGGADEASRLNRVQGMQWIPWAALTAPMGLVAHGTDGKEMGVGFRPAIRSAEANNVNSGFGVFMQAVRTSTGSLSFIISLNAGWSFDGKVPADVLAACKGTKEQYIAALNLFQISISLRDSRPSDVMALNALGDQLGIDFGSINPTVGQPISIPLPLGLTVNVLGLAVSLNPDGTPRRTGIDVATGQANGKNTNLLFTNRGVNFVINQATNEFEATAPVQVRTTQAKSTAEIAKMFNITAAGVNVPIGQAYTGAPDATPVSRADAGAPADAPTESIAVFRAATKAAGHDIVAKDANKILKAFTSTQTIAAMKAGASVADMVERAAFATALKTAGHSVDAEQAGQLLNAYTAEEAITELESGTSVADLVEIAIS